MHSSKLDKLGLRGAVSSFCREVSAKHKVRIDFQSRYVPYNLQKEISLGLFGIMQESVQNSQKHSGATHIEVSLTGGPDGMQLVIKDSGKGFVAQHSLRAKGIGLASMRERLKLVDGQLSIQSEPGRGTTISARVPFRASSKSATAGT